MTEFCFGCLPPYAAEVSLREKQRLKLFVEALDRVPFVSDALRTSDEVANWAFSSVNTRCTRRPTATGAWLPSPTSSTTRPTPTRTCTGTKT